MTAPWQDWMESVLGQLDRSHLRRQPRVAALHDPVIRFSTNDYLGLSVNKDVVEAAMKCWQDWGAGIRSSALIAGRSPDHEALEIELAEVKGTAACLLFPSGYAANVGLLSALASDDLEIFSDAENHASIIDGCRFARSKGTRVTVYSHLDLDQLRQRLAASSAGRKLIVTDSLFSMSGDFADLPQLVKLAETFEAALCVDEAHASLVFGASGGGLAQVSGVETKILFQTGTLSKGFGLLGGFVATSAGMRSLLFNQARSQVFSTALPAPIAAAARVALSLGCSTSGPRQRLRDNMSHFQSATQMPVSSPILTLILNDAECCMQASRDLAARGLDVPAVRPPTVPANQSRLRISLSASHSRQDLDHLINSLRELKLLT